MPQVSVFDEGVVQLRRRLYKRPKTGRMKPMGSFLARKTVFLIFPLARIQTDSQSTTAERRMKSTKHFHEWVWLTFNRARIQLHPRYLLCCSAVTMSMIGTKFLLAFVWQVSFVASQNCNSFVTCSDCIQNLDCAWCSKTLFVFPRCLDKASDLLATCEEAYLHDPSNTVVLEESPLEGSSGQVTPSSVSLTLRAGGSQEFVVSVYPQQNVPVDFYLLMDDSDSFADDLATIKMHANSITDAFANASTDGRFGFGVFVDKPTPPFVSVAQLEQFFTIDGQPSSCKIPKIGKPCVKPFSYQHLVAMSNSSTSVLEAINDLAASTNADGPEGTLDAMLQAILCKDVIGWRNNSRKLVLVFTDDVMHSAGDGKLASIHTPHDGKCHMELVTGEENETVTAYTASLDYDYPSLDQVNLALLENSIVPIFFVGSTSLVDLDNYFDTVSQLLGGVVRPLPIDGVDTGTLLTEAYQNISTTVKLTVFNPHDHVAVNVTAFCTPSSTEDDSILCNGVKEGEEISFLFEVSLLECTSHLRNGGSDSLTLSILGYKSIQVEVSGECECPLCDSSLCLPGYNGEICSGRGDCACIDDAYKCICNQSLLTNNTSFGLSCECSSDVCFDLAQINNSSPLPCSGHGTCDPCVSADQKPCSCDPGYYGNLCPVED